MLKIGLSKLFRKIYVEVITDENTEQIAESTEQKQYRSKTLKSPKILKCICNIFALMFKE